MSYWPISWPTGGFSIKLFFGEPCLPPDRIRSDRKDLKNENDCIFQDDEAPGELDEIGPIDFHMPFQSRKLLQTLEEEV